MITSDDPEEPRGLTESRSSDRLVLARRVRDLCREHCKGDVSVRIILDYRDDPNTVAVELSCRYGLSVTVDFNGATPRKRKDIYVLSWHFAERNDVRLAAVFAQDVNPYHQRKATDVFYGTNALLHGLSDRLAAIADGTAFTAESQRAEERRREQALGDPVPQVPFDLRTRDGHLLQLGDRVVGYAQRYESREVNTDGACLIVEADRTKDPVIPDIPAFTGVIEWDAEMLRLVVRVEDVHIEWDPAPSTVMAGGGAYAFDLAPS